ncbi:MAG TPA: hypothetical protein DCP32_06475 [Anaerolineaceae bacterium]|nr:MAG: hypothetical protein A2X24_03495 [Chloroflexi bacterium GWB2_54_36]HAL16395.1 hypothetical protein [Anaerolineaceae bacterium]HBA91048.1 hypothetical protein [Anaerolineaceae bacterium]
MDELVALVVKKTGLSEEVARKAVATVIDFLKKKLPAPVAGQIDLVLGKGGGKEALAKGLANLTGKK